MFFCFLFFFFVLFFVFFVVVFFFFFFFFVFFLGNQICDEKYSKGLRFILWIFTNLQKSIQPWLSLLFQQTSLMLNNWSKPHECLFQQLVKISIISGNDVFSQRQYGNYGLSYHKIFACCSKNSLLGRLSKIVYLFSSLLALFQSPHMCSIWGSHLSSQGQLATRLSCDTISLRL